MDTKQVKQIADKEVNKHEKRMHQGMAPTKLAKGGKVSASSRADGIASRGKTRGRMI